MGRLSSRQATPCSLGSRFKTRSRLLVSEWHLQIWTCLLQWRKAAKARRKVCERSKYHYLCKICTEHDHNSLSRFCCTKDSRKRRVRAVLGNHNFEQPQLNSGDMSCLMCPDSHFIISSPATSGKNGNMETTFVLANGKSIAMCTGLWLCRSQQVISRLFLGSRGTSKLGMSGRRSLKNPAACLTPRVTRCVFDMSGHDGHDEFLVSHTFVQGGTSGHHFGVLICPYSLSLGSFFCSSNDFLHACFQGLGLFKA